MRRLMITFIVALLFACSPSKAFAQEALWWWCNVQSLMTPKLFYFTAVFGPANDTSARQWAGDFKGYVSGKYADNGRGGCAHFQSASQAEANLKRTEDDLSASSYNERFINTGWRPALTQQNADSPRAMIDDPDIFRAAKLLIDQRGEEAAAYAGDRSESLLAEGDVDGCVVWRRIPAAIEELMRGPRDGERLN